MCDKKTTSIVHAQEAPVELVTEFMMTAERELAAFYDAVLRRYGLKEARKAAQAWIEELETMDWPPDCPPELASCDNRCCRLPCLQNHRPFSEPMRPTDLPSALGMDDDQMPRFRLSLDIGAEKRANAVRRFSVDDKSPIQSPNAPSAPSEPKILDYGQTGSGPHLDL